MAPFVVYLSPLFCLLAFIASANSIKRRIASEREGLSFCCLDSAQLVPTVFLGELLGRRTALAKCYFRRDFVFAARASSTRRRIAAEREGLSSCCLAQLSICDLRTGDNRTAVTGSWPVAGRPRFFRITGIDFTINLYYVKASRWKVAASHRP